MKNKLKALKPRGLYGKFLERLFEANSLMKGVSKKDYLPFPVLFEKLCRGFSVNKEIIWECLFLLREFGFLEIIKFKGVQLNFMVKNG